MPASTSHVAKLWPRVMLRLITVLGIFGVLLAVIRTTAGHRFADRSELESLDATVRTVSQLLKNGDVVQLQGISTDAGWSQMHRCYDFQLSALGFKGTFVDHLKLCGEQMLASRPSDVVRTYASANEVVLYFDRTRPNGVTIALSREKKKWRISYLSPGEIDPNSVFPNER